MPSSGAETILTALLALLDGGLTPDVLRNEVVPLEVPSGGLVILRDGEAGEPIEVTMSPLTYHYDHIAEVEVYVQGTTGREAAFDAIRTEIGAALGGDRTLGGLCDWIEGQQPRMDDIPVTGGKTLKAVVVPISLNYGLTDPLT